MNPYDVSFVDTEGKTHGFMLAKNAQGLKSDSFVVQSKANIPQAFVSGAATYDNITPEKISPLFICDDWRKGFGDEDYTGRYHDANGTDARFKNRIMLAPKKQTSLTLPTGMVSDGFETWDDANNLTNWPETFIGAGSTLARDDANERSGTYSARLFTTLNGGSVKIARTFTWDAGFQGKNVTATVYATAANVGNIAVKIGINDGVTDTWSSALAATGAYTAITVTKTLAANATALIVTIWQASTTDIDRTTYVDDFSMTSTATTGIFAAGTPLKAINFGSSLVVASGTTLYKSTDGATFTAVQGFPATISDLCVYGSTLYIALGTSSVYYYTTDLLIFTASVSYSGGTVSTTTTADYAAAATAIDVVDTTGFTTGDHVRWEDEVCTATVTDGDTLTLVRGHEGTTAVAHASGTTITEIESNAGVKYMANVADTQFWVTTADNVMRDTDDPTNNGTPFSTAYTLPNSAYNITCLLNDPEGYVYAGKQDMPYVLSEGDVVTLVPELASDSSTAGVLLYKWKGDVFIRTGVNKLYRYSSDGTVQDISPVNWAYGNPDYDEDVQAFCSDSTYLYVFVDNGSDIILMAGREETVDGTTDWVWHPLQKFTEADNIVSAVVSSVTGYPVIYALTGNYADGVLKFCASNSYGDTNLETGYEFISTGIHYGPWIVTNFDVHDKYWSEVFLSAKNFDGLTSIRVYYQAEGDEQTSTWNDLGMCSADSYVLTSSKVTTYPKTQVSRKPIDVLSRKIRFRFDLTTALNALTVDEVSPIVLSYVVYGRVENSIGGVTTDKKDISLVIACHGSVPQRTGAMMNRTVGGELSDLLALKASQKSLTMFGFDGIERTVKFKEQDFGYQPDTNPTAGPTFAVACRLEET